MLFNSSEFLIFFTVVVLLVYCNRGNRWLVMLIASYVFYAAWSPLFLLLLLAQTLFCWWTAKRIDAATTTGGKQMFLGLNVSLNLVLLAFFKYFYFLHDILLQVLNLTLTTPVPIEHPWTIILPLGISFHTFQGIAYAVDVYRGQIRSEQKLRYFALFHCFFPQLIAGPIERASSLLPQMSGVSSWDPERFRSGAKWFLWGLFKKSCIADQISPIVSAVYGNPADYVHGPYLLIATILFGIQIYCDFSGYSDMALGAARMLGIELTVNFRQPYFSTSLAEFWRRWHITLSFWFRDYVYYPLGGNRVAGLVWGRNIMIVFLLSGLWHGAAWTFVVWGAIHGVWLMLEKTIYAVFPVESDGLLGRCSSVMRWLITLFVVMISWVFFRADSLPDAWFVLSHCFTEFQPLEYQAFKAMGVGGYELIVLMINMAVLFVVDAVLVGKYTFPSPWAWRWARVVLFVLLTYDIIFHGIFHHSEFIYFQF